MAGGRLLIINGYYPRPEMDSGSVCIVNLMRVAVALGLWVSHLAPTEFALTGVVRDRLDAVGVRTIGQPEHASPEAFLQEHGTEFAVVVLSGYAVGSAFYDTVRQHCPQARIIFNAVDMHHVRYVRQARVSGDEKLMQKATDARAKEMFLVRNCDATIVVSDAELGLLRELVPEAPVFHVPLIRDIPGRINGFSQRADIAFVGHFRHPPNPDAANTFVSAIWPRVHHALPDARFRMIGAGWPRKLPVPGGDGVEMVGHVVDLRAALESTRLTVAPLRFGAGAKGKVVTSLAHGVPCVATPIAAEGMGLTDGVNALIAANPADFAERVVALYRDEVLWNRLSEGGIAFAERHHSIGQGTRLLRRLLTDIGVIETAPPLAAMKSG